MSKSPKRARQVADAIQRQIAFMLKKEVRDPRLTQVSITMVDVSPDLTNAKIYFTTSAREQLTEVEKAFSKATAYLRRQLADNMDMRYVPTLQFVYDKSLEHGGKISDLIDEAIKKDQQNKPADDQ